MGPEALSSGRLVGRAEAPTPVFVPTKALGFCLSKLHTELPLKRARNPMCCPLMSPLKNWKRDEAGREAGGAFRAGNTCTPRTFKSMYGRTNAML